ncbi:hypothetical protein DTO212C5_8751 [Paecilomyces variotii]|nr:hypothetical protein DTO212C5_8751 [Paecilomyces variotii]
MDRLPVEIVSKIIDYLTPREQVQLQLVSRRFLALARDNHLWRLHCYEASWASKTDAVSARPASESLHTSSVAPLSSLGPGSLRFLIQPRTRSNGGGVTGHTAQRSSLGRRSRAAAEWDPSYETEDVDWYSEYIDRHGPISFSWLQQPYTVNESRRKKEFCDVKGMGLFRDWSSAREDKVVAPVDNGGVVIWDLNYSHANNTQTRKGRIVGSSAPGVLLTDTSGRSRTTTLEFTNIGECMSVDSISRRAYIAVGNVLNEIDLETLRLVSQKRYAWSIFAMSQETDYSVPLTLATTLSLHIYDSRLPAREEEAEISLRCEREPSPFLSASSVYPRPDSPYFQLQADGQPPHRIRSPDPSDVGTNYAPLFQPGPLSILHPPAPHVNTILLAGRFPSILSYDRRFFPQLQSTVHSGGRLCGLASIPAPKFPVSSDATWPPSHRIVACGEYNGKGSLELYDLTCSAAETNNELSNESSTLSPPRYQNRQSAASSKLLSVASHGTRIAYSDSEGNIKWVERDGRGEVRRFNINSYHARTPNLQDSTEQRGSDETSGSRLFPNHPSDEGDVARKILPTGANLTGDELLVWTGDRIGRIRFAANPDDSMDEEDDEVFSDDGLDPVSRQERRHTRQEEKMREQEYSEMMRRALEMQGDEVIWMGRLGMA